MKIDAYVHILPPKFLNFLEKKAQSKYSTGMMKKYPTMVDLDSRFRFMDRYPDTLQVLTVTSTQSMDQLTDSPAEALDLAKMVNDEMAELVEKYPDRFVAGIASLPMNDMDMTLKELERAINDLRLRGVFVPTPINGKAVDRPEFMPFYEAMSKFNLPIFIHPAVGPGFTHYLNETEAKYGTWLLWGWPYETAVTMTRLVFSGVMQRYPNLKILTHHAGSMVPYFNRRIEHWYDQCEMIYHDSPPLENYKKGLTRDPMEYFRMFYNDTNVVGSTPALMCAYDFFGAEHLLFGTDIPVEGLTRTTIESIERMDIPDSDKEKIFWGNAKKIMRLALV